MDFQGFSEALEGRLDTSENGFRSAREQDRVQQKRPSAGAWGRAQGPCAGPAEQRESQERIGAK